MTNNKTKTTITNVTKEKKKKQKQKQKQPQVVPYGTAGVRNNNNVKTIFNPVVSYKPSRPEKAYLDALIDPFAASSEGVRVPDRFPFPTVVEFAKNYATIGTDSNGNLGFVWLPSVSNCLYVAHGSTDPTIATDLANIATWTASTGKIYCQMLDGNLSTEFKEIRTVAAGIAFGNDIGFNNITGKIICSPFICPDLSVNQLAMSNSLVANTIIGLLTDGASLGAALSSPGSFELSIDTLIDRTAMFTTRPIDPTGYRFHKTTGGNNSIGNGYDIIEGGEVYSNSTGLMNTGQGSFSSNSSGLIGWVFTVTGAPASTPVLNCQFITHVEGQANSVGTGNSLNPALYHSPSPSGNVESVLSMLPQAMAKMVSNEALMNGIIGAGKGFLSGLLR